MNLETKPENPFQLIDTTWSKISARKAHTMPLKEMKRKIQCDLESDMSGASMSFQAFVLSTQGRPNGATFESTNLGGTLGFNQKLSLVPEIVFPLGVMFLHLLWWEAFPRV